MALSAPSLLTSGTSDQPTSSAVTTGSFTPTAGALVVCHVYGFNDTSTTPSFTVPSTTGQTFTFTKAAESAPAGINRSCGAIFVSTATLTATASTITFDIGSGVHFREATWYVYEVTGQHASPIGATGVTNITSAPNLSNMDITLSAAPASSSYVSAHLGCDGSASGTYTCTVGTSWSSLSTKSSTADFTGGNLQYITGSTSTAVPWVDADTGSMALFAGASLAVEIKAAAGAATPRIVRGRPNGISIARASFR